MNADTCHGGLRAKRCLPAEFHFESCPLPTYLKTRSPQVGWANHALDPQVAANHSQRLKARQLTLFYRLLPYLCRIRPKVSLIEPRLTPTPVLAPKHQADNLPFKISCLIVIPWRLGDQKQRPRLCRRGLFSPFEL